MNRMLTREWDRIPKSDFSPQQLLALQTLDERHSRKTGDTIFDWNRVADIRVRNWVGVIQVRGLSMEILPKIEQLDDMTTRRNLVYMLSVCRALPLRERELASMDLDRLPILEALMTKFAESLLTELQRGPDHGYIRQEENSSFVRGKILMAEHIRRNAALSNRVFIAHDELIVDTWLNRILKYVCRFLLRHTRVSWTQRCLRNAIHHLDDVEDVSIELHHIDKVQLTRNSERFRALLDFCRMVLANRGVLPKTGELRSFSLLFPMEKVFEEFIARSLSQSAARRGIERGRIHAQARGRQRFLLRDSRGKARFQLKPDILIDGADSQSEVVVDTKWKHLNSDGRSTRNGVRSADIYQLAAYSRRYEAPESILLYPRIANDVTSEHFTFAGSESRTRLRIATVDLGMDLMRNRATFIDKLGALVLGICK